MSNQQNNQPSQPLPKLSPEEVKKLAADKERLIKSDKPVKK